MEALLQPGSWLWVTLGVLLMIVEIFAPGFVFLWMGIAAMLTGAISSLLPGMSGEMQFLLFAALSIASVATWQIWARHHPIGTEQPDLNCPVDRLTGHEFVLDEPLAGGKGRLKIGDGFWAISGPDLPAGARIRVTGGDGTVLRIEEI